jgi:4-amino-4-deoxy-L-arabinose transferase-like glycosyltransferase
VTLAAIRRAARLMAPGSGLETIAALLILAAGIGLRLACVDEWSLDLKPRPDALEYALIARQFASASAPVLTIDGEHYPSRYPYGTPLCFAPVLALTGGRLDLAYAGTIAFAACALWLTYLVGRRLVGPWGGVLALAICAMSTEHARFSGVVMSEIPSALILLLIAWLWLGLAEGRVRPVGYLALGLLAGFAGSIRYPNWIALLCLLADASVGVLRRRSGARIALLSLGLGAALSLIPQLAYNAAMFGSPFEDGYRYWEPDDYKTGHAVLLDYAYRPFSPQWQEGNLVYYGRALIGATHALYRPEVFALAVIGLILLWRERRPGRGLLLVLLPLGTALFYSCYFFRADRMLVPVLSFLAMLAALPVARFLDRVAPAREWVRALGIAVVVGLLGWHLSGPWQEMVRDAPRSRAHASLPQFEALRQRLDPAALVVLDLPLALGSVVLPGWQLMPLSGDGVDRHLVWILEHGLQPLGGSRHVPSPLFFDRERLNPVAFDRVVEAVRSGRRVVLVYGYLGAASEMKDVLARSFVVRPYAPGGTTFFTEGLWAFELEPQPSDR